MVLRPDFETLAEAALVHLEATLEHAIEKVSDARQSLERKPHEP
jgi:hypothetical protein